MATIVKFYKGVYEPFKGDILAVFPQFKHNKRLYGNDRVVCYAHVGQHTAGDLSAIEDMYVLAEKGEFEPLQRELQGIGYELKLTKAQA